MRIIFICGCLEPGRDGVGDYTHSLSKCLSRLGHDVICISINDSYISRFCCYTAKLSPELNGRLKLYRFSSLTSWYLRFKVLPRVIEAFKPDWVSLQYVPYSFSPKGLPFWFTFHLSLIRGPWSWHIMFHELWIGRSNRTKDFITSCIQEHLIKYLVMMLRPMVIHTSIEHYRTMLSRIGLRSALLPLHSNIPVFTSNKYEIYREAYWIFLFFGSLDSKWEPKPFFDLVEAGRKLGAKQGCHFITLGRKGEKGKKLWDAWTSAEIRSQYPTFSFQEVGVCSEQELSIWLQRATFGISMAPNEWIGKSGSVAAMIEHGLPVIVPSYQSDSSTISNKVSISNENFLSIDSSLPINLCKATRFPVKNMVLQTARCLLSSL